MSQPEPITTTSQPPLDERIQQLKTLIPEAFSEGRIDFDKLRAALGEFVDESLERYNFTWAGKRDALRLLQTPTRATLTPCPEESIDWETTRNIFIEGDNLEALKLMLKPYYGRVKMIYIDPPYNTGNDFIYPDNYADPLATYLQLTGQKDADGNLQTSNPESSGRYHSAWLSMMYPRLFLARQLLREDGAIFISIDNNEVHNLRAIMNEIFGEENFVALIANVNNPKGRSDEKHIATAHEYILIFQKSNLVSYGWEPGENVLRRYNKTDSSGKKYREIDLRKTGDADKRADRPNLYYYFLYNPDTGEFFPTRNDDVPKDFIPILPLRHDDITQEDAYGRWRWELETAEDNIIRLMPKFMPVNKRWTVIELDYLEDDERITPTSAWTKKSFNSERGSEQFIALDFDKETFPRPKPVGLLQHILEMSTPKEDDAIILDFFAGSCTLAEAIFIQNKSDGGTRRMILVQLPESLDNNSSSEPNGFVTIADIGKERIRRVIARLKAPTPGPSPTGRGESAQPGMDLQTRTTPEDLGFKVYKLAESNLRGWAGLGDDDGASYAAQMELFNDPLVAGWQAENLICEVALKEAGFSLNYRAEQIAAIRGQSVFRVTDPEHEQHFYICLDERLALENLKPLQLTPEDLFICRAIALDDAAAANLALQCRLKTI